MHELLYHEIRQSFPCLHCLTPLDTSTPGKARSALICAPHAGGSADYFRRWAADMPRGVALLAVQYPGRGERIEAARQLTMEGLLDDLMPALIAFGHTPYVLLGHSMGAAVMFESCCRLEALGYHPRGLVLSSHPPLDQVVPENLHRLDDDALWRETIRVGGTARGILDHPELIELLTPILRSDYQLIDEYRPERGKKVQAPVSICLGDDDPSVPVAGIRGWQSFCARPIQVYEKRGGHFYLNEHHRSLIDIGTGLLRSSGGQPACL